MEVMCECVRQPCDCTQIEWYEDDLSGPVTVPMVSTNSSPPIAMPVQVPPGHVVQQIVDENGALRHVILSPQPPMVPMPPHYLHPPIVESTIKRGKGYHGASFLKVKKKSRR
uniref:Uncharacterized protein n=1 Tax=Timema shepardi TaxID=629360 RepID=A0A7R9G2Z3_TIMSH|nr:unnamed protein product [Timema shepardi]